MTVSQRAHNIRQINPDITWQEAMSQAYEEVARPVIEDAEKEAGHDLESFAQAAADAYNDADLFMHGNDLVAEIITQALDNADAKGIKYPASWVLAKIEEIKSMEDIRKMIFWQSNNFRYTKTYRLSNGRISSEWWETINELIDKLDIDEKSLDSYDIMKAYFI